MRVYKNRGPLKFKIDPQRVRFPDNEDPKKGTFLFFGNPQIGKGHRFGPSWELCSCRHFWTLRLVLTSQKRREREREKKKKKERKEGRKKETKKGRKKERKEEKKEGRKKEREGGRKKEGEREREGQTERVCVCVCWMKRELEGEQEGIVSMCLKGMLTQDSFYVNAGGFVLVCGIALHMRLTLFLFGSTFAGPMSVSKSSTGLGGRVARMCQRKRNRKRQRAIHRERYRDDTSGWVSCRASRLLCSPCT